MKISTIPPFLREAKPLLKKYGSLQNELEQLIEQLAIDPTKGTSIGRNCYKIRLKIASKGKVRSGGARVVTCVVAVADTIYLLSIYDKSELDSIADKRLQELLKFLPPVP